VLVPTATSIRAGKVRGLAVATKERVSLLPDVPTVGEAGLPGTECTIPFGVSVPAGTPREVVTRLNAAFNEALADATTRAKLAAGLVWCLGARYIADRGIRRLRREESCACRACVREGAPFSSALMSPFSSERLALQSTNLVGQFSPFTDLVRQRFCLSIDRKLMIINT